MVFAGATKKEAIAIYTNISHSCNCRRRGAIALYFGDAIALVQASLIHVMVGDAIALYA